MIFPQDLIIALVIVLGLFGSIVQILPGALLVWGAILAWSILTATTTGWIVFGVATLFIAAGMVLKYVLAGVHLKRSSVKNSSVVIGLIVGAIGFFIIPVAGLPLGFIAGVYVCEFLRTSNSDEAWKSTVVALKATGITILVELGASLVAVGAWIVGLIVT